MAALTFRRVAPRLLAARAKGTSSHLWLERQNADPYVSKAKQLNYRCRSAFKLIEIDDRTSLLAPGLVVVDLGAAPGSWAQVAVDRVNANGRDATKPRGFVCAVDRQYIFPLEGATVISNVDFESEGAHERVVEALDGKRADVVLSDMAPNATGVRSLDQDKIVALCYRAFRFAALVSKKDACFLVKVWDGAEVPVLAMDLGRFYKTVKNLKPNASRTDSAEKFLLARGFKGLKE